MPRSALAIAILVAAAALARAACPRDALYPAEVPWIPCPRLVLPSPCTWCPQGDQHVDVTYDRLDAGLLAKQMSSALVRPWTIDSTARAKGVTNLVAHDAHHHLWIRIAPGAEGRGSTMHVELSAR